MLVALCAWTLYVWITRIFIMAGQDEIDGLQGRARRSSPSISIAFGLAAGWIGLPRPAADRAAASTAFRTTGKPAHAVAFDSA